MQNQCTTYLWQGMGSHSSRGGQAPPLQTQHSRDQESKSICSGLSSKTWKSVTMMEKVLVWVLVQRQKESGVLFRQSSADSPPFSSNFGSLVIKYPQKTCLHVPAVTKDRLLLFCFPQGTQKPETTRLQACATDYSNFTDESSLLLWNL